MCALNCSARAARVLRVLGRHQEPSGPLVQAVHDAGADHSRLALARQPGGLRVQVPIPICSKAVTLTGRNLSSPDWACCGKSAVCRAAWGCLLARATATTCSCQ